VTVRWIAGAVLQHDTLFVCVHRAAHNCTEFELLLASDGECVICATRWTQGPYECDAHVCDELALPGMSISSV
jgi:hypothetical protein